VRPAAGLKDFRWHDLRHSCASFLAASGASLVEIGSVLGHRSPSVTARYAHLVAGKPVTGHAKLDEKLAERQP
jgi:site-specific recombinase XerD